MSLFAPKPLGHKSYGSIAHLPGSRLEHNHAKYSTGKVQGKDVGIHQGQADLLLTKPRKGTVIIVEEKLDGSNVAIARVNGQLVTMTRSGKPAINSKYEHHRLFALWVQAHAEQFDFLLEGERLCGEWLAQAHGTIYKLPHDPFVAFDLIQDWKREGTEVPRLCHDEFMARCDHLVTPSVLHVGGPCTVKRALSLLDPTHHGAQEMIEGCVWRAEFDGKVGFLAKYVRPDKVDGKYLPEISGGEAIWNWRPT